MDQTRFDLIPNPAVRRLSLYLRQLEAFKRKERRTISSKQLGESLNLTDAQVRKDLAYFGQFGHPGIGYRVADLIVQLRKVLGTDKTWNVLLIGAGNLGRALMAYNGFDAKGFRLVAVFDIDPGKIGKKQGPFVAAAPVAESGLAQSRVPAAKGSSAVPSKPVIEAPKVERVERSFTIQPISELKATVEKLSIRLAILAVPAEVAQDVADEAVAAGVRGILNFAPVSLTVPKDVALNAVDLAVQLEQLSYQVNFSPKI